MSQNQIDKIAPCRLCLYTNELCNSHIVPEFLFKTLYSKEKHQFTQIAGPPKVRKWQKGFREEMLCSNCEKKLNKWETYVDHLLFGGTEIVIERMRDALIVKNVSYEKFKLFQLSLIWRAGISSLTQFSNVNIGPHEEKLRVMLDKGDPGEPYEYGCLLILTPAHFSLTSKMMMLAQATRFDGHRCYMFLMAGFTWVFFVSKHTKNLPFNEKLFLSTNGVLPIIIENTASKNFFEKTFFGWKESGNLDRAIRKNFPHYDSI